jgi:hypothetical protein
MRFAYLLGGILLLGGLALAGLAGDTDYRITGEYFETCTCDPACPCIFKSDPTRGHCNVALAWHIESGRYGEVELNGLNVVVMAASTGNMSAAPWRGAMYLDERATTEQQQALQAIYSGLFGAMFSEMTGPKAVAIAFAREGDTYSVRIPDVLAAAIEPLRGPKGNATKIAHMPLGVVDPVSTGRSLHHRYKDADLGEWDYPAGRNGFFAPFEYAGGE